MAKKKSTTLKIDYKGLLREIKKTRAALKKAAKKVTEKGKKKIALEIKLLGELEKAVRTQPKMSKCVEPAVTGKMSKCAMAKASVTVKMSKC